MPTNVSERPETVENPRCAIAASKQVPLSKTRFSTHAKAQATFMLSFVE